MARHRRYHGRSRSGKAARKWVSLAGKLVGGLVVASPAITAVQNNVSNPGAIPSKILFQYTGFSTDTGQWSPTQAGIGIGSIVGGLVLVKVFSYVAKRF